MNEFVGLFKWFLTPSPVLNAKYFNLGEIEREIDNLFKSNDSLIFSLIKRDEWSSTFSYEKNDLSLSLIIDKRLIFIKMKKNDRIFFNCKYYRHSNQFDYCRYDLVFTNHHSPVYHLCERVVSCDFNNAFLLESINIANRSSICTIESTDAKSKNKKTDDELAEELSEIIVEKSNQVKNMIEDILITEGEYLTLEEEHNLSRYLNVHIKRTLEAYLRLKPSFKIKHYHNVIKRFASIETKVSEIHENLERTTENALIRQLLLIDQHEKNA